MKPVTAILLVCIYVLSLIGPGLKTLACCNDDQQVSVSSIITSGESKESLSANCHAFKLKDVHLVSPVVKTPNYFNVQFSRPSNTGLQQAIAKNVSISGLAKSDHVISPAVPVYLYSCILRL